jgi:hypothetical protein
MKPGGVGAGRIPAALSLRAAARDRCRSGPGVRRGLPGRGGPPVDPGEAAPGDETQCLLDHRDRRDVGGGELDRAGSENGPENPGGDHAGTPEAILGWLAVLTITGFAVRSSLPAATRGPTYPPLVADAVALVITVLPVWGYLTAAEAGAAQGSWGKRQAGLRVVSADGQQVSWGRAAVRNAVKLAPWQLAHVTVARIILDVEAPGDDRGDLRAVPAHPRSASPWPGATLPSRPARPRRRHPGDLHLRPRPRAAP